MDVGVIAICIACVSVDNTVAWMPYFPIVELWFFSHSSYMYMSSLFRAPSRKVNTKMMHPSIKTDGLIFTETVNFENQETLFNNKNRDKIGKIFSSSHIDLLCFILFFAIHPSIGGDNPIFFPVVLSLHWFFGLIRRNRCGNLDFVVCLLIG